MKIYKCSYTIFDDEGELTNTSTTIIASNKDDAYRKLLSHYFSHEIANVRIDEVKTKIKTRAADLWTFKMEMLNERIERRKKRKALWDSLSPEQKELNICRIASRRKEEYDR
jgi:hypothetical protein